MTTIQPPDDDGRGLPGGPDNANPIDIDAAFTAIVSGISGEMHWGATEEDLDAATAGGSGVGPRDDRFASESDDDYPDESPQDRLRRRELRRLERLESFEAHQDAEAERAAELAADNEHFIPPPPPPVPRPARRTVGAILLIAAGVALLTRPTLLAVNQDVTLVLALLLIVGGGTLLATGLHRRRPPGDADGWDDGAVL